PPDRTAGRAPRRGSPASPRRTCGSCGPFDPSVLISTADLARIVGAIGGPGNLGVQPSVSSRAGDAGDSPAVGRHAHVELLLELGLEHFRKRSREDRLQLLVHLVL